MICELTKTNKNALYCVQFANSRREWKMHMSFAPLLLKKHWPDPDTFRTVKMIIKMTVHCSVRAIKCKYISLSHWPRMHTQASVVQWIPYRKIEFHILSLCSFQCLWRSFCMHPFAILFVASAHSWYHSMYGISKNEFARKNKCLFENCSFFHSNNSIARVVVYFIWQQVQNYVSWDQLDSTYKRNAEEEKRKERAIWPRISWSISALILFFAARKENNPLIMRFAYTGNVGCVYPRAHSRKNPLIEIIFVRFRWQWSGAHTWLALCNFQLLPEIPQFPIELWVFLLLNNNKQQTTQLMTCMTAYMSKLAMCSFACKTHGNFSQRHQFAVGAAIAAATTVVVVWKLKALQNWFDYNEQMNKVQSINFICKQLLYTWKCVCVCA